MNIFHPIQSLQKWAITKLLEGIVKELPVAKEKVTQIWEQHKYEIFEKVTSAIKKTITDFIKKKIEEQRTKTFIQSDN